MHFSGPHVKIDMIGSQHTREALDNAAHLHVIDAGFAGW